MIIPAILNTPLSNIYRNFRRDPIRRASGLMPFNSRFHFPIQCLTCCHKGPWSCLTSQGGCPLALAGPCPAEYENQPATSLANLRHTISLPFSSRRVPRETPALLGSWPPNAPGQIGHRSDDSRI